VLAKEPVPGRVKTRLCPPLSPAQAADLAAAALRDSVEAAVGVAGARVVLVLEGAPPAWLPAEVAVVAQRGDGLDERLAAAYDDVGGGVLIGMDTPQVTPALLREALDALGAPEVDSVLGHARDGGWWAIGLERGDPDVFLGVPMSTERTGAAQEARLRARGDRVHLLPELVDVDHAAEAAEVAAAATGTRFARAWGSLPTRATRGSF
jgi:rSAM/selenodomain-associated transferase 1